MDTIREYFGFLVFRYFTDFFGNRAFGQQHKFLYQLIGLFGFPYRIHDLPDPDKLENLNWFINRFGYKIRTSGSKTEISKSINRLLDDIKNKKEQNLVETVSLRAMQKARYSTHNIGHYGLAFDYYTHFTSPIRRFPDMMVHRLLTRYLAGGTFRIGGDLFHFRAMVTQFFVFRFLYRTNK